MGTPTGKPSLHRPSCPPDGCACWYYSPLQLWCLLLPCSNLSLTALGDPSFGSCLLCPISNVPSVPQVTSPWAPVSFAPVSQGAPRS